jgi:hypothetical protein
MSQFEPRPDSLITSEMLRQDFIPDVDEVLRIIHLDESATGTDTTIALGIGALCIASAGGILALSGLTAPILLPIFGVGMMAISSWNSRVTQRDRQMEAEFLTEHPEILSAVEQKANQGEEPYRIANAFESAYRAYLGGDQPQLKPTVERAAIPTASIGESTKIGAIPVPSVVVVDEPTAAAPETYPMASREVSKDDRQALIARLKEDCPLLLKLVKSHPIRAVGAQRTGKTTLVKRLALLRMVLLPGHQVVAATPHYEPANPYPNAFKVVGVSPAGKRDYPEIEREWFRMSDLVESCQTANLTYVWDEFGLFDKAIVDADDDKDKIKRVLTSCLRETMKFGIYPVFIVHGETAAFLPGSKGLVTVFLGSTVRVETIGEPVEDDMGLETLRPTGRFNVTWLDGTRDEGKIPDWLTEQYLLDLIGDRPQEPNIWKGEQAKPAATVPTARRKKFRLNAPTATHKQERGMDLIPREWHQDLYDEPAASIEDLQAELDRIHAKYPHFREISRKENADVIQLLEDAESDEGEFAFIAEIKRFLAENPDGAKVKDFVNRARKPVRKTPSDDVKFVLDLMTLEGEIYEVDGTFFLKSN